MEMPSVLCVKDDEGNLGVLVYVHGDRLDGLAELVVGNDVGGEGGNEPSCIMWRDGRQNNISVNGQRGKLHEN